MNTIYRMDFCVSQRLTANSSIQRLRDKPLHLGQSRSGTINGTPAWFPDDFNPDILSSCPGLSSIAEEETG